MASDCTVLAALDCRLLVHTARASWAVACGDYQQDVPWVRMAHMCEQVVAVARACILVASSHIRNSAVVRSERLGTSALHAGNWNTRPAMPLGARG
jgi:hypothetical protein